jgi:hypothetical protein
MKKIVLIIPYFGKLPDYFPFFMKTVKYNPDIDFIFITDNIISDVPKNVILRKMTFVEFVGKVRSVFDFKISLNSPYKLVDYKPAYGYIFEEEIQEYEMWGYCDIDQIFGDILGMLPDDYNSYDKIFSLGHLTLFKNNYENNRLFMNTDILDFKKVFQTNYIHVFDEIHGVEEIFKLKNKKMYNENIFADIGWKTKHLERVYSRENVTTSGEYHNQNFNVYLWNKGKLYGVGVDSLGLINYVELMYFHFQKRNLGGEKRLLSNDEPFLITYKGFEEYHSDLLKYQIGTINKTTLIQEFTTRIRYLNYIWKRRINKYLLKK